MPKLAQRIITALANPRRVLCIAFILAFAFCAPGLRAAEPPPDLARKVAAREAENESARSNYTYKQTVVVEEVDKNGARAGDYREVREVIFSPSGDRTERVVGQPSMNLKRLKLTEEDFRDLREVQPFLFTPEQLFIYETKYKGEETVDGIDCWVLQVRPRQILHGQRLFDGIFWIDQRDYSIIRSEGQAVPQIRSTNAEKENLFPHFTTVRQKVGDYWFPIHTYADDTLFFGHGSQRMRLIIRYANYQRFGAESTITVSK
jgi:hypothetical protein